MVGQRWLSEKKPKKKKKKSLKKKTLVVCRGQPSTFNGWTVGVPMCHTRYFGDEASSFVHIKKRKEKVKQQFT